MNLSKFVLSDLEINVLSRGLTFVPTPKISRDPITHAVNEFGRKLKLHNYFYNRRALSNNYTKAEFTEKSTWTPSDSTLDPSILNCIESISEEIQNLPIQKEKSNLSDEEFSAIKRLKQNCDIVIKKSDKSSVVVVMDKSNYVNEGLRQLSNQNHYKQIDQAIYPETSLKVSAILQNLFSLGYISAKQLKYLSPPETPRQRRFYMLPKIHKDQNSWPVPGTMPPGRPIVSDCNSESEKVASFIDSFIKPRANKHPSYIKDTYDFLEKVRDMPLSPNSLLITLDVESMYTNINHDEGIQAIRNAFSDLENDPKFNAIVELLELSLRFNDFEFDNKIFLQMQGTAMGRKYAPHYADIYMAQFEQEALAKCTFRPDCYYRYLDDIFMVWSHGRDAFNEFLSIFNSHRPSIKFKAEINSNSVNFLDTTLFRSQENSLEIKVYFKPTDTHELLHKMSFHPRHTFAGLIKSQVTRFYRICTNPSDLENACQILFRALSKRNYSKRWLRKIKNETLRDLNKDLRLAYPFQNPTSSKSGASPCNGPRCQTCYDISTCQNFSGSVYDQTYSINAKLDCNSSNIIYLYTCKLCQKQYVGETSQSLRERNNRHRTAINCKNEESALYNHLVKCHSRTPDHSIELYSLVPIEQVPDLGSVVFNKIKRLEREYTWIDTLCTFEPYGLNVQKFGKFDPEKKTKNNFDLIYVVPFSKTGNASAQIVKKHLAQLNKREDFNIKIAVAYKKHKNLKDILVRSKLS